MATIAKNIPKMAESVSEKYVPSNALSVVKGKVDSYANTIKKDMDDLSKEFKNVSILTNRLAKKGTLAGSLDGKSLKYQVTHVAKRLDNRVDMCKRRAKNLTNAINKSAGDMRSTLVKVCQSWDEYQAKFKKYEL